MIGIKVDVDGAFKGVENVGKQLPFALARTFTALAKDGQAEGMAEVGKVFRERNDWTRRGIRIKPATKQDLSAEVYTDTGNRRTGAPDYLKLQEDGGEIVIHNRRRTRAVPTRHCRQLAGGDSKPIPDWLRPKALLDAMAKKGSYTTRRGKERRMPLLVRGLFFFVLPTKSGEEAIFARHPGDGSQTAYAIYNLVRHARVKKRFHLDEDVRRAVDANTERRWNETIADLFPLTI